MIKWIIDENDIHDMKWLIRCVKLSLTITCQHQSSSFIVIIENGNKKCLKSNQNCQTCSKNRKEKIKMNSCFLALTKTITRTTSLRPSYRDPCCLWSHRPSTLLLILLIIAISQWRYGRRHLSFITLQLTWQINSFIKHYASSGFPILTLVNTILAFMKAVSSALCSLSSSFEVLCQSLAQAFSFV